MNVRRLTWLASILAITAVGLSSTSASADTANFQAVPVTEWRQPGTAPLDGVGQWVYVAPIPPAQPGQVAATGYVYGPTFLAAGGGIGEVGLSTDDQGPIAGIKLVDHDPSTTPAPVTIRYGWSPGHFYFVLAYHLPSNYWGGWVYDLSAAAWTFIGAVKAPAGWGLADPTSTNLIRGAIGQPMPPFWQGAIEPVPGTCGAYPRVDVYFFPPFGFRGSSASVGALTDNHQNIGTCPTVSTVQGGLVHQRFGSSSSG